ncbi:hypothetical protein BC827DRAFT_1156126 [Russula dissimulans]|nr:hypothetical protein BC827DRAFT_1156126 [Russula dissimulans]
MSGYQYATPQGQGGYQQQPPYQPQQAWSQPPQQSYPPQQGGYQPRPHSPQSGHQAALPYPNLQGYGAPQQNHYGSPQPGQYGSSQPPGLYYGSPSPPGQYGGPPPQGWYGSPSPQQQQWGPPPQYNQSGPSPVPEKPYSVVFKFSGTEEGLSNSTVRDPSGKTVFRIESDKKHTNVLASDGTIIATLEWNHSHPTIHLPVSGNKKMKITEWFQVEAGCTFEHDNQTFGWDRKNDTLVHLEFADRPGHPIIIAREKSSGQELEVFREALLIPGLLELSIVGIFILESRHDINKGGMRGLFNKDQFMEAFVSHTIENVVSGALGGG